jgi:type I restriction enzyme R subunit
VANKEAKARIRINELLRRSGWRFFDGEHGAANIQLEAHVKLKKKTLDEFGDDFDKTADGYVDYLLLDERGFSVAVLEAKRESLDPLVGKEKARQYARSQNVRFVILSNGNLHYFWDLEHGNPTIITEFPNPDSPGKYHEFKPNPEALAGEDVADDYITITQNANYRSDPRWEDSALRAAYVKEAELKFLRPYQLRAIEALQRAVAKGQTRFLFEMATGTGKTLTAAAIIKLFLRTGNAQRVLFLVDRLELEDQARKRFVQFLKNDYHTIIYEEDRDNWRNAEIVVTTVQSLLFHDKYRAQFSPTDLTWSSPTKRTARLPATAVRCLSILSATNLD